VPSLVHIWASPKEEREQDPTNFATVLQWQPIRGDKAVLYSVDNPLIPPAMKRVLQKVSPPKTEALQGP